MIIRAATPDDALPIATIHVTAWRVAYQGIVPDEFLRSLSIDERHQRWQKTLQNDSPTTWVAQEGKSVLGWLSAGKSRDDDAGPSTGEIWAVYIDPDHWAKGVGRALCDLAVEALQQRGFTEATLWVLAENERAIRFYRANGFIQDHGKEQRIQRGGKDLWEIRMRKAFETPAASVL